MTCTICEAIEWRNNKYNAYVGEEFEKETTEECIDYFVGPLNLDFIRFACVDHEPDLAASLLRIEKDC